MSNDKQFEVLIYWTALGDPLMVNVLDNTIRICFTNNLNIHRWSFNARSHQTNLWYIVTLDDIVRHFLETKHARKFARHLHSKQLSLHYRNTRSIVTRSFKT